MRFANLIKQILSSLLVLSLGACAPTDTRRGTGA